MGTTNETVDQFFARWRPGAFGGMLHGTTTALEAQTVRSVGPNHAFVDAEQGINGADGAVMPAVHVASLLRRDGRQWCFVDSRPYSYPHGTSRSGDLTRDARRRCPTLAA